MNDKNLHLPPWSALKRHWWLPIGMVLALAVGGFIAWASIISSPMPEALTAMTSDAQVSITHEPWLAFQPSDEVPQTGLILYPGGRVDPRAYAPPAHEIAQAGYLVVIVPMPLNLAVTAPGRAAEVIQAYENISHWVIGGHSLGGAMAARFAGQHPDVVVGLVLWASYPAESNDLSKQDLTVVSIYGTRDGLATIEKIDASRPYLPPTTMWVAIEGGNHAQFGWYGDQRGDNPATISRAAQQAQIVTATLALLEKSTSLP
jgi:hypothetical protein